MDYLNYISQTGDKTPLDDAAFALAEFRARKRIDYLTDCRVAAMAAVPEAVKLCMVWLIVVHSKFGVKAQLDGDSGMDLYHPTVISGVSWHCETAASVDKSGLNAANKFTIRIPEDADFSGKSYVEPFAYHTGDPSTMFTLKNGDIIVKGAVEQEGLTPSGLKRMCGETVTILSVTDNRRAPNARHWRVAGK